LRILHTSHKGLPDHRIEREAYIARTKGHSISFLGFEPSKNSMLDVFDDTILLKKINYKQIVYGQSIREEWAEQIRRIDPDLIHANDIIAAVFSSNLGIPMVYDDHEYWSAQRAAYDSWPLIQRIRSRIFTNAIPKWERDILSKHVTITVSEGIAREHRLHCSNVLVLQNFNLKIEVEDLPANTKREGLVFVGNDLLRKKFLPHRDLTGLKDYLSFDDITGLTREALYLKLLDYRFGLLPFLPVPYHKYANSSKLFDYYNCGLQVIITRDLYLAHGELPFAIVFDKYAELPQLVRDSPKVDPAEIMRYAHKNLVWEAQQNKLFEAYKLAIESS